HGKAPASTLRRVPGGSSRRKNRAASIRRANGRPCVVMVSQSLMLLSHIPVCKAGRACPGRGGRHGGRGKVGSRRAVVREGERGCAVRAEGVFLPRDFRTGAG